MWCSWSWYFKNGYSKRRLFVTLVAPFSDPAQLFLASLIDVVCSDAAPCIIYVGEGRCTHWEGVFLTSTGPRGNQYCSLEGPV